MSDIVEVIIRTIDETTGVNGSIIGSFTELNNAISLGKQAVDAVGQAYNATIGDLVQYSDAVREMQQVTGGTSESAEPIARSVR